MKKHTKIVSVFSIVMLIAGQVYATNFDLSKPLIQMVFENPDELNKFDGFNYDGENITNFMGLIAVAKDPFIMEEAIKKGGNINTKTKGKFTPLHILANNYNATDVLDVVLKHTQNIDSLDSKGRTPLMEAITAGQSVNFIKRLLKAGANINLSSNNETAISLAAEEGRDEIIALLLENGANAGPKALKKLQQIDALDQEIKKHQPNFDFTGISRKIKKNYISYLKKNKFNHLEYIKYNVDGKSTNDIIINSSPINKYIHEAKLMPDEYMKEFNSITFNKENIFKKYIGYAFVVAQGIKIPELSTQYRGEFEIKTATKEEYDDDCVDRLQSAKNYYLYNDTGRCQQRVFDTPSIVYGGGLRDAIHDCVVNGQIVAAEYPKMVSQIKSRCKTIQKPYKYAEIGNGFLLYLNDNKPIAGLLIKEGKTVQDLSGIPYSKIIEEMTKKYGKPNITLQEGSTHHHYFSNIGDWQPVMSVEFQNKKNIKLSSYPTSIRIWFIHKNTEKMIDKIIDNLKTKDDTKEQQKEEKAYWEKLKNDYEKRINSFSL